MLKNTNKNTKFSKKNKLNKKRKFKTSKQNRLKNIKNKTKHLKGGARPPIESYIGSIITYLKNIKTKIGEININDKSKIGDLEIILGALLSELDSESIKKYEAETLIQNINNFIESINTYTKDSNYKINNIVKDSINGLKQDIIEKINVIIAILNSEKELFKPIASRGIKKRISINDPAIRNYSGLSNCGNSCYMNATLQLLFSIPAFYQVLDYIKSLPETKLVKKVQFDSEMLDDISFIKYFETLHAISELFKNNKGKGTYINMTPFYPTLYIGKKYDQEDSTDFLIKLLDSMTEILQEQKVENPFEIILGKRSECVNKLNQRFINSTNGLLSNEKIMDSNIYSFLTLGLYPEAKNFSDLINKMCDEEIIDDVAHCNYNSAKQNLIIKKTSQYLILSIKRFDSKNKKLLNEIIPEGELCINNLCYKLKSCVIQNGTTKVGHYIYLNFDQDSFPMYVISDSTVSRYTNEDYVSNGYIYLYELIP